MSGQRASDVDIHGPGTATSSRRVRVIAVAAAVLSVALCGAVAQASSAPDVQAGAGKLVEVGGDEHKAAGIPSSSDVVASDVPEGEPVPPDDLGDDPQLDGLATACFEGDLLACDHLYLQSPVDSDYEEYGDTCGGRQSAGTWRYCALGGRVPTAPPISTDSSATASTDAPLDTATTASTDAPPDTSIDPAVDDSVDTSTDTATDASTEVSIDVEPVPPDGLGSDPELDALAESCYAGDMEACDELVRRADSGSEYQAYGDTCAGRQPPNTGNYCTALEDPVAGSVVTASTDFTVESQPAVTTTSLVTAPSNEPTLPTVPGDSPGADPGADRPRRRPDPRCPRAGVLRRRPRRLRRPLRGLRAGHLVPRVRRHMCRAPGRGHRRLVRRSLRGGDLLDGATGHGHRDGSTVAAAADDGADIADDDDPGAAAAEHGAAGDRDDGRSGRVDDDGAGRGPAAHHPADRTGRRPCPRRARSVLLRW